MIAFAKPDNIIALPQKNNEWYTPARYIEAAREVMGGIDLDPASSELANRTVRATRFYTAKDNGLAQEWYGRVWLNPPYGLNSSGKSNVVSFTARLHESYQSGRVTQAVYLTMARTEATWFYPLWQYPLCFTNKRIFFYGPDSKEEHFFGTVFAYLGPHEQKFIDVFSKFGTVAKRVSQPRQTVQPLSLWEVNA